MSSPPWEPQRPPTGPPPGWQQPNPYGPAGGHGHPPPWPGPQWPPGGQPPPYGPPPPAPYGGFGAPPPFKPTRSKTGWIIGIVVAVVAAIALFSGLSAVLGLGPRDERSYQAGREEAETSYIFFQYGGSGTAEDFCDGQFTLSTIGDDNDDLRRRDFIAGCLDVVEEKMRKR